jgi:hypothetical protein
LAWILEYQPKILLPRKGLVNFEPFWYQEEVLNSDARFRLINKSRQIGFSTCLAAEAAWEFAHVKGAQIIIVSKNLSAARNFHKYIYNILYSIKDVDPDFPDLIKANSLETTNEIGSSIISLPASAETGRSFSASHWYFDEIAFTAFAEDIFQASAPTIAQTGGRITVFSTPKGRESLFYELYSKPEEYGFEVFEYFWWDCPTYNPYLKELKQAKTEVEKNKRIALAAKGKWYRETRKKFSELAWKQEFECSFDADKDAVFSVRQLKKTFRKNYLLPFDSPTSPDAICYGKPKTEGHYYVTGIDLGRKNDPTVLLTYDITAKPAEVVEYKRVPQGSSWDEIILTIRETYDTFKPDMICDATGVGDVIAESISDIAEPYVISDNAYTKNKYNIIENLRRAMDAGALLMPKIPQLYSEHEKYRWQDKGIVQDTVIANALAVQRFYEPEGTLAFIDPDFSYMEQTVTKDSTWNIQ